MNALPRRSVIAGLAAAGGLALAGCGSGRKPDGQSQPDAGKFGSPMPPLQVTAMTVYRDPRCGCCEAWAGIARQAGYEVRVVDRPDMPAIKRQYGVPDELLSCHTSVIGDYAIEGHVPLEEVKRLLAERPAGIRGIAVAGMPLGSPGMETPDRTKQSFQVMAFDAAGRMSPFRV